MKNVLQLSPSSMVIVFIWVVLTTNASASTSSIPSGESSLPGGSAQKLLTPTKRRGGSTATNNRRHPHRRGGEQQQQQKHIMNDDATSSSSDTSTTEEESSSLVFTGDCKFTSEPCPVENKGELIDFFNKQDTMKLFLSAGGKRPCRKIPLTTEIRDLWKQASIHHYGGTTSPPDIRRSNTNNNNYDNNNFSNFNEEEEEEEDVMVMATETDAQFPGFKMITTVLNGCKRYEDKSTGLSTYEFCMIGDKKRIVGSPPVVWLVKKLTGQKDNNSNNNNNDKFQLSETKAKSVISMIETQPNQEQKQEEVESVSSFNNNYFGMVGRNPTTTTTNTKRRYYSFQLDLEFATSVKFPKMLLKMLPASKSKVEERGTESVKKAIMKDASSAVQVARETWMNQIQQQQEKEQAD